MTNPIKISRFGAKEFVKRTCRLVRANLKIPDNVNNVRDSKKSNKIS